MARHSMVAASERIESVVLWQNMPTHHQAPWISALADRFGGRVCVGLESGISEERRRLGWDMPDYGRAAVEIGLDSCRVERIIREAGTGAVHVFSGLGAYQTVHSAFLRCTRAGRRVGLLAEGSAVEGLREQVRTIIGNMRRVRFGDRVDFILGIGDGVRSFRRMGFDPAKIFDFAYFPPEPDLNEESDERFWKPGTVRIVYIGQLIPRKGIDILLEALSNCVSAEWQLVLVGGGADEPLLKRQAARLNIQDRVTFVGPLATAAAMAVLQGSDLLVLPTRDDGWGVVVSEALYRGVPVICSDRCGARLLVARNSDFGSVYSTESSLESALLHWAARGRRTASERERVRQASIQFRPLAGATHFLAVLDHIYGDSPCPVAPWLAATVTTSVS